MNLRKSLVNSVATVGLLLGLTGGIAAALPVNGSDQAELNVTCAPAASISVTMNGAFSVDLAVAPPPGGYSADIANGVTIVADLTCNNVEGWVVGTGISQFNHVGPVAPTKAANFNGNLFHMSAGGLDSYVPGPTHVPGNFPPVIIPLVFPNFPFDLAMTTDLILFDWAAPGVTTATWDAELDGLPANLALGTYQANLDVVLYVP